MSGSVGLPRGIRDRLRVRAPLHPPSTGPGPFFSRPHAPLPGLPAPFAPRHRSPLPVPSVAFRTSTRPPSTPPCTAGVRCADHGGFRISGRRRPVRPGQGQHGVRPALSTPPVELYGFRFRARRVTDERRVARTLVGSRVTLPGTASAPVTVCQVRGELRGTDSVSDGQPVPRAGRSAYGGDDE